MRSVGLEIFLGGGAFFLGEGLGEEGGGVEFPASDFMEAEGGGLRAGGAGGVDGDAGFAGLGVVPCFHEGGFVEEVAQLGHFKRGEGEVFAGADAGGFDLDGRGGFHGASLETGVPIRCLCFFRHVEK